MLFRFCPIRRNGFFRGKFRIVLTASVQIQQRQIVLRLPDPVVSGKEIKKSGIFRVPVDPESLFQTDPVVQLCRAVPACRRFPVPVRRQFVIDFPGLRAVKIFIAQFVLRGGVALFRRRAQGIGSFFRAAENAEKQHCCQDQCLFHQNSFLSRENIASFLIFFHFSA